MFEAAGRRDVAAVTACYADDAVAVSPLFGTISGAANIGANWATLFRTFTDLTAAVSNILVDGDRVAVMAQVTTSDREGIFGIATGDSPITYRLVLLFKVVDGKIAHDERLY